MESALRVVFSAAMGLCFGSFLNVVVWRVPRGLSVNRPPSACPACGAPIKPYDNIPLLSWIVLRGRCRRCDAEISVSYPLVEAAVGLVWAGLALFTDRPGVIAFGGLGVTAQLAAVLLAEQGAQGHRVANRAAVIAASIGIAAVGVAIAL